ncbi:hypothetical protein P7C73_g4163, partial [Tremellales sp. Uapishka_1]
MTALNSSPPPNPSKNRHSLLARLRKAPLPSAIPIPTPVILPPLPSQRERRMSRKPAPKIEDLEMDDEWERIRTLPRICLIPAEDEGEPVVLYPVVQPQDVPDPGPLATITDALINRPSSVARPSRQNTWGSMASGFEHPAPVFSRRKSGGPGYGVVMPKKRSEVAVDARRMSRVDDGRTLQWSGGLERRLTSPPPPPPPPRPEPPLRPQTAEESAPSPPGRDEKEIKTSKIPIHSQPQPQPQSQLPPRPQPPPKPIQPAPPPPGDSPKRMSAYMPLQLRKNSEPLPEPAAKSRPKLRARALSLSAAKAEPVLAEADIPPVPSLKGSIRKQKSLKKFFFTSSSDLVGDDKDRDKDKVKGARRPSLKIDTKISKPSVVDPLTPGLNTASSTSGRSEAYPETPQQTQNRPLAKRFSLSNLTAFKKKSFAHAQAQGLAQTIPKVPDLPAMYKKPVPLPTVESAEPLDLPSDDDDNLSDSDSDSEDVQYATLMHVSPRTRRDPSVSLQDFLASAPLPQRSVMVVPKSNRQSFEAIILGPLLVPDSKSAENLGRVNEEDEESESDAVMVSIPADARHSPPLSRFESPEAFLRRMAANTVTIEAAKDRAVPIPLEGGFSSLKQKVQLKSLHFEGLGLDFERLESWHKGDHSVVA